METDVEKEVKQASGRFRPAPVKATLLTSMLVMGVVYSMQAPFYPAEADSKGVNPAKYGFVFGVYELASMLLSIPIGNYVCKLGPRRVYLSGLIIQSLSVLVFGSVTFIYNIDGFLAVSFICRLAEGFGKVLVNVSVLTIISLIFPKIASTLIAWNEAVFGLGYIIAPVVGGLLYDAGGFFLPFLIVGSVYSCLVPLAFFYLPKDKQMRDRSVPRSSQLIPALKVPRSWFGILCVIVVTSYVGFISATFEPFVRHFNLGSSIVGLIFATVALSYAIATPIWGRLCDKGISPIYCIATGGMIGAIGIALLGIPPWIPVEPNLYTIVSGLAIMGTGSGGFFVPVLMFIKRGCFSGGLPDDVSTHGAVSGLFVAAMSTGGCIGPSIGGILFDHYGFRIANFIYLCVFCIPLTGALIFAIKEFRSKNEVPVTETEYSAVQAKNEEEA